MTPDQVKAARELLGWTPKKLAGRSGTTPYLVSTYERSGRVAANYGRMATADLLAAIRAALEEAGVEFTDEDAPGVWLRKAAEVARLKTAAQIATAHHEAGHAVAAVLYKIRFQHLTVAAGVKSVGHVLFLRLPRGVAAMHSWGMVAFAGEAAQRRFNPRSVRLHHGGGDRAAVATTLLKRIGSPEQAELLARLWEVQARDMVRAKWPAIQRVAAELLARQMRWPHLIGQVGGEDKLVPGSGYAAAFSSDAVARACPGNSVGNTPRYASSGVRPASAE